MSSEATDGSATGERLSALADGELDSSATKAACELWKRDAQARCTWHAYHLIGDVLRSDDLAAEGGRDERFLLALRARLAGEPVVLEPAPWRWYQAARNPGRWVLPATAAAGFLLVVGTFSVLRPGSLFVIMGGTSNRSVVRHSPGFVPAGTTPLITAS